MEQFFYVTPITDWVGINFSFFLKKEKISLMMGSSFSIIKFNVLLKLFGNEIEYYI